jgi:hypothetical protein
MELQGKSRLIELADSMHQKVQNATTLEQSRSSLAFGLSSSGSIQ